MKPKKYVVRLGSFAGHGPYLRARDGEDWTITFDQRRAHRFASLVDADLFVSELGDARPVLLVTPRAKDRG